MFRQVNLAYKEAVLKSTVQSDELYKIDTVLKFAYQTHSIEDRKMGHL